MIINKIKFSGDLYKFFSANKESMVLKERTFKLRDSDNRNEYVEITENYKKWIYWISSYELDGYRYNRIYFNDVQMRSEYSFLLGNQLATYEMDTTFNPEKKVKSVEEIMAESLKKMEAKANIEYDKNNKFKRFFKYLDEWDQAFVVNCVPNVKNGNYVNVPVDLVEVSAIECDMIEFDDTYQYFNDFMNRLPIQINKLKIGNDIIYNILNKTIIPLFITMEKQYIISKDIL